MSFTSSIRAICRLCPVVVLLLISASPLCADDDSVALPEFDPTGFTRIFDGETLDQWDGDPTYWSVEEGRMIGTITPDTLLSKNSWIVWRGGLVEDFELVLDYRVSAQGNSGVGYRLAVLEDDPYSVRGPQADIQGGDMFTGICYEENGRRLLAARGQSTWIEPGGAAEIDCTIGRPGRTAECCPQGGMESLSVGRPGKPCATLHQRRAHERGL